jgi:acetolactate synthase-1/2/3 large subunit
MAETIEGHGGELALSALRAYGVTEMFTLSGGHVFPLYDAAHNDGMPIYDVRHEQSAVFAAEAVAKLQRRPGLAVLTAGPGVTNGISGLTSAHFNGSPVLVLGGRAPAFRWGAGRGGPGADRHDHAAPRPGLPRPAARGAVLQRRRGAAHASRHCADRGRSG